MGTPTEQLHLDQFYLRNSETNWKTHACQVNSDKIYIEKGRKTWYIILPKTALPDRAKQPGRNIQLPAIPFEEKFWTTNQVP